VTDNVARRTVARDLDVSIRASARSPWLAKTVDGLLAPPFRRDRVLAPDAVAAALDALAAATPLSPEQSKALGEARAGRYATVLGAIPAGTDLASSFLRGLSMMALGENLEPAANQFREAIRFGSDFMPAAVYLGACFAAGGRDREAMAAWQLVGATDAASPLTNELLADAMMRTDRHQAALEMLMEAHDRWPDEAGLSRRLAAAQIETGQRDEALATLDALVAKKPDDLEGLFLAMYLVAGEATKEDAASAGGQKLARYARAYLDAQGPYRAIVEQWVEETKVPD
jgi:tetratricopeptide (TPR) repeat protein